MWDPARTQPRPTSRPICRCLSSRRWLTALSCSVVAAAHWCHGRRQCVAGLPWLRQEQCYGWAPIEGWAPIGGCPRVTAPNPLSRLQHLPSNGAHEQLWLECAATAAAAAATHREHGIPWANRSRRCRSSHKFRGSHADPRHPKPVPTPWTYHDWGQRPSLWSTLQRAHTALARCAVLHTCFTLVACPPHDRHIRVHETYACLHVAGRMSQSL